MALKITVTKSNIAESEKAGYSRITKSGAYVGEIALAKAIVAASGTEGIQFNFKADNGGTANNMQLWLQSASGEVYAGFMGIVEGMAYLCKQRELNAEQATISEWDYNARAEVQRPAYVYKGLMGKRLGLILQAEKGEYNGKETTKINIIGSFDPETRFTASELIDKADKPEKLDKRLATLKDKQATPVQQSPATPHKFEDFEDDIPF